MRYIILTAVCLLFCGCPAPEDSPDGIGNGQAGKSFTPAEAIPAEHPLISYDGLWLGMDSLAMSQAYNAPQGKGDGFNRVIQEYGDVTHHIINFDPAEGEPLRRIVASFYRDELYIIVDRREGISLEQRDAWFGELVESRGDNYEAILPTSQWSWGEKESVLFTFTQDNASENLMTANIVLEHAPTWTAAHAYLEEWEREHPQQ